MGNHGVISSGVHPNAEKCGITVEGKYLPFDYNDDTVYFRISKPTEQELDQYKIVELNSSLPLSCNRKRRLPEQKWESSYQQLPMLELRKRFAYQPDAILKKTLDNTTQFYLEVPEENKSNPERHFQKRFSLVCVFL